MNLDGIITARRALRALDPVLITTADVKKLAGAAALSPSCFNNQPWRFVFVRDGERLDQIKGTLSSGNEWAKRASLVIAVCARRDDDCVVRTREYYLFDSGMATAFLLLKATEMGIITHPIAGFDAETAARILAIPEGMVLITLIICGAHSEHPEALLNPRQLESERERPPRHPLEKIMKMEKFSPE